jgi:CheY-like chemotaxis protein
VAYILDAGLFFRGSREEVSMPIVKSCPFYRESDNLTVGLGIGHCDLGGDQVICDGDIQFCHRSDDLKKRMLEEKKKNDRESTGDKLEPSNYRVLVVDDQEAMRKLIVALLSKQGHECITASDGVEALSRMAEGKCDVVITDIVMPGMDGITLTKELLIAYPGLPIIVITAFSQEYGAESAILAGARDFIMKPFSINEFLLRFNKTMNEHEMRRMEAKKSKPEPRPDR